MGFWPEQINSADAESATVAIRKRKPTQPVLFHTDRGAEYRAHIVQQFLVKHNITASMSRPGCCTDNAEVESFFHSLKAEFELAEN